MTEETQDTNPNPNTLACVSGQAMHACVQFGSAVQPAKTLSTNPEH